MEQIILILHVCLAIALIVLILLQQGKGATMGASFGSGASQTVFGSQGAGSFLLKLTGSIAILFFITRLVLGHFASGTLGRQQQTSLADSVATLAKTQYQAQQAAKAAEEQLNSASGPANTQSDNGADAGLKTTQQSKQ